MCLCNHNSKKDLGTRLKQSPLCNFFQFRHCRYFIDGPKRPCHNENKNTCKELSQNEACSLDIGTQYWTDLYGIALKNNRLNVAVANIRHWGLVLICILYTAWQRGVFAVFLLQRTMTTWVHFVWAQSYTANVFVYTKVRALAKYNLFQPVNHRFQFLCDSRFD